MFFLKARLTPSDIKGMITHSSHTMSFPSGARGVMKPTPVASDSVSLVNPAKPQREASAPAAMAKQSGSATPVLQEIHCQRYESYAHYGLNE
jgi:hypothetical protein